MDERMDRWIAIGGALAPNASGRGRVIGGEPLRVNVNVRMCGESVRNIPAAVSLSFSGRVKED